MTAGIKLNRVIDFGLFKYNDGGVTFHVGTSLFAARFEANCPESFCSISWQGAAFSGPASSMATVVWRPKGGT